ncbi:hypothetical protein M2158_004531 [Streptomyces sp. SAI-144]|nr:hypothetical protein [Streptomyces sp. SAI-144]MDH6435991.1 hypothetical protein [Streptomyces sp. SAI-144]
MFEIRVICEPDDADRVSQTLATAFDTGPASAAPPAGPCAPTAAVS